MSDGIDMRDVPEFVLGHARRAGWLDTKEAAALRDEVTRLRSLLEEAQSSRDGNQERVEMLMALLNKSRAEFAAAESRASEAERRAEEAFEDSRRDRARITRLMDALNWALMKGTGQAGSHTESCECRACRALLDEAERERDARFTQAEVDESLRIARAAAESRASEAERRAGALEEALRGVLRAFDRPAMRRRYETDIVIRSLDIADRALGDSGSGSPGKYGRKSAGSPGGETPARAARGTQGRED